MRILKHLHANRMAVVLGSACFASWGSWPVVKAAPPTHGGGDPEQGQAGGGGQGGAGPLWKGGLPDQDGQEHAEEVIPSRASCSGERLISGRSVRRTSPLCCLGRDRGFPAASPAPRWFQACSDRSFVRGSEWHRERPDGGHFAFEVVTDSCCRGDPVPWRCRPRNKKDLSGRSWKTGWDAACVVVGNSWS